MVFPIHRIFKPLGFFPLGFVPKFDIRLAVYSLRQSIHTSQFIRHFSHFIKKMVVPWASLLPEGSLWEGKPLSGFIKRQLLVDTKLVIKMIL